MITIRTGNYTQTEITVLLNTLKQIHELTDVARVCDKSECETCPIKHLCGDILRAKEHIAHLKTTQQKGKNFR